MNDVDSRLRTTVLHWAAWHGKSDICSLLLSRGAKVSQTNRNGNTLLHFTAACHRIDICQLLVHRADVTSVNNEGQTPLHRALDSPAVCCMSTDNK